MNGISPKGKYMYIHGGVSGSYINPNAGAQGVGNMRYNTSSQRIEVYDGYNWLSLYGTSPQIGLSDMAEQILDWAAEKMAKEQQLETLAETNPTIADLVTTLKETEEKIDIVLTLTKNDKTNGNYANTVVTMSTP